MCSEDEEMISMKTWMIGICLLLFFSLFMGACASRPKPMPEDTKYECVAQRGVGSYHRASCVYVQKIDDKDAIHFHTEEEAKTSGLRPCEECIPSGKKSSE